MLGLLTLIGVLLLVTFVPHDPERPESRILSEAKEISLFIDIVLSEEGEKWNKGMDPTQLRAAFNERKSTFSDSVQRSRLTSGFTALTQVRWEEPPPKWEAVIQLHDRKVHISHNYDASFVNGEAKVGVNRS